MATHATCAYMCVCVCALMCVCARVCARVDELKVVVCLSPKKLTIYKLGNYEATGVIGMYKFPRSIHTDFMARRYQLYEGARQRICGQLSELTKGWKKKRIGEDPNYGEKKEFKDK